MTQHHHVEQNMYYASATEVSARHPRLRMMQNSASQKVALIAPAPRHSFDEMGDLHLERQILRPSSAGWISEADFEKSHWCEVDADRFKRAWNEECEGLPTKQCQTSWLLTGLILPIWSSVPGENQRIYRVRLEDGGSLLGRALSEEEAAIVRGRVMEVNTSDPASILDAVQNGARQVELGQGLMLQRKRVAGHMRLEITGADKAVLDWLRALGCFTEIHQFTLRLFIPSEDEAKARSIIAALIAGPEQAAA